MMVAGEVGGPLPLLTSLLPKKQRLNDCTNDLMPVDFN